MTIVSEHRPTEDDVKRHITHLRNTRSTDEMLSKRRAAKLRKEQDDLVNNYTYTKADIEKSIQERNKRRKTHNIGMEKTKAMIAVQAAQDALADAKKQLEEATTALMESDDPSEEGQLERKVQVSKDLVEDAEQDLQNKLQLQAKILEHEESRKRRAQSNKKTQDFVNVNMRAKKANQLADYQSYKEQREKQKEEATAKPKFNPFQRRKAKPQNLWYVGDKDDNKTEGGATAGEQGGDSAPSAANEPQQQADNQDRDNEQDDKEDAMDTEEPPSLVLEGFGAGMGLLMNNGSNNNRGKQRVRKGISLSEYLERKAAGTL